MSYRVLSVRRDLQSQEKFTADQMRKRFTRHGTLVVNLLSSPGSGKTTLLEATLKRLSAEHRMAVLVGDIATERDAERLARYAPAVQLTTGGACHLDLALVERGLEQLAESGEPVEQLDFLFLENIGNLVCPASHDLGEHLRVILLAVTEGDDKPAKYPKAFRTSQAMILSKIDLLPYVPFSTEAARTDALSIQGELNFFCTSATTGEGIEAWCDYLLHRRQALFESLSAAKSCV